MLFVVSLASFTALPFDFAWGLALAFAFVVFGADFFLLEADLGAGVAKLSKNCLQTTCKQPLLPKHDDWGFSSG